MSGLAGIDAGTGPVVVLLHAFPCDSRLWAPQVTVLADAGFRVIAPDLPGFGGSPLLGGQPSLVEVAASVLAHLDARGVGTFLLGGVSLGGYVAMAMLRVRPEAADALLLCGTRATADSEEARANRRRLARLVDDRPAEVGRVLEQSVLPGLVGRTTRERRPDALARLRGWVDDAPAATVAWYQRAMAARPDSRDVLASTRSPALVLWGEQDALSPRAEQDLMLASLASGRLAVVAEAGHLAGVERPEEVGRLVRQFALEVTGRPSA